MASFSVFVAGGNGNHLSAEQPHAEDVGSLPRHVFLAHVHNAFHPQQRRHGGGGHAVLPRPGLRHQARLAHSLRQQSLPQAVVDFVRAGVQQVFALQIDLRATQACREPLGVEERSGPAGKVFEQARQLRLKRRIAARRAVGRLQLLDGSHQRFRRKAAAEFAEPPARVRTCMKCHIPSSIPRSACSTSRKKASQFAGVFYARAMLPRRWPHPPRRAELPGSPAPHFRASTLQPG